MNQETNDKPIWGSMITEELVDGWTDAEIEALCADLDDAVMHIVEDHQRRREN